MNKTTKTNNELITMVMYYSLFHKEIFDNKITIINQIPKNAFGVFSTIRRAKKLLSYPKDIHGCIGYWEPSFTTLRNNVLYSNLLRVSYDSVWNDDRNTYFTPIEKEPQTTMELDFMLNPIYKINKETGIIIELNTQFTNKEFGIIVQTKDKSHKATYLPNVFDNISWKNMVESIKNKAMIASSTTNADDIELFAYKIIQIKATYITLLTNELFGYFSLYKFSRILLDNMKPGTKYPFFYACKNHNTIQWNNDDDVRNISALGDLYKYSTLYPDIVSKSERNTIFEKIIRILQNIDNYSSQSLSFLGQVLPSLPLINAEKIHKNSFCKKLLHDLPNAEDEFEKPEIIIGLNKCGCTTSVVDLTYDSRDSIFKINWTIQAITSYGNKIPYELHTILQNKLKNIVRNIKTVETNELAVAFECACFIYHSNKTIIYAIFELLFELEQRKNCNNSLYMFLTGYSRVDITFHIINGLLKLHQH